MANASTHVRIDPVLKEQASALFAELGTDMSGAITMFLRQCVMRGGIPFPVEKPRYSQELLDAVEEAKRLESDPNTPRYRTMEEYHAALNEDDE